jgi:FkbM family methyltransferase
MLRIIKKMIKYYLRKRGYILFRNYYFDFGANGSIKKVFKLCGLENEPLIIIDVGANVGQSVERFKNNFDVKKIFSFEPNPDCFAQLIENHKPSSVFHPFNVGLGSVNGTKVFFEQPDSGSGSFLELNIKSKDYLKTTSEQAKQNHNKTTLKKNIVANTEISVLISTLDKIISEQNLELIHLLKIDTQGYEKEVLSGAPKTLNKTLILEVEVIFADLYKKQSKLSDLEKILAPKGFVLWDIPYIGKLPESDLQKISFIDALFVNTKLLSQITPRN